MPTRTDVYISMVDGVRLAATLYMPEGVGPWPAILEALPYRKDDITASYRPEYERLSEAGYVLCRLDIRGTGSSEGLATDEYTEQEHQDLEAVIDWLATQEWSSGNVGMYGTSYSGFNSLQMAARRPAALKAIVSIFASDDRYQDDVHYFGGVRKQLDLLDYPMYMVASNALPPVPSVYGSGWRELWRKRIREHEPWELTWFEHQTWDPYWQHASVLGHHDEIEAATMIVSGWADSYRGVALRAMEELRCPKKLLFGPWGHVAVDTGIPGPNIDLVAEMLRWWDHWLKDLDNGVDREAPITVFVRRPTEPRPDLRLHRGEWRFEESWPLARARELPLALAEAETPASQGEGPDELRIRGDVGWTAWISCAGVMPWGQPQDQRPDEVYSLVYEWAPLDEELEILGIPRLEATVRSSTRVAFLSAKICDVHPDGTSQLVVRGLLNLSHRDSRSSPAPLEPGKDYAVRVPLESTSWVFEPGHRIRLDLAGADWPNAWPPPHPGTLTVERADATLVLPAVDEPSPISEKPNLPPPKATPSSARSSKGNTTDGVTWKIEHDVLARETRAEAGSWGTTEAGDGHPRFSETYGGAVGVSTEDPGRAWVEARGAFTIEYPEATVSAEARHRIESDAEYFDITIELETAENGEPRGSRRWNRRIPRRLA